VNALSFKKAQKSHIIIFLASKAQNDAFMIKTKLWNPLIEEKELLLDFQGSPNKEVIESNST
jgi:hypothetical protein